MLEPGHDLPLRTGLKLWRNHAGDRVMLLYVCHRSEAVWRLCEDGCLDCMRGVWSGQEVVGEVKQPRCMRVGEGRFPVEGETLREKAAQRDERQTPNLWYLLQER